MEIRSVLHVEGSDDFHSLIHLLIRHGVDYDAKPWPTEFPVVKQTMGKDALLDSMALSIELGTGRSMGFVLDADDSPANKWAAVMNRLRDVGLEFPVAPPTVGYVGDSSKYGCRVGIWLMPDNQRSGCIEDFLRMLVDEEDMLIRHAESSTSKAKSLGALFSQPDENKAVLHFWLAWQEEPGLPYGTAMKARYFRDDSPAANSFVAWFRALYHI